MPALKILLVPKRSVRAMLWYEWVCLPLGGGGFIGSLAIVGRDDVWPWLKIVYPLAFLSMGIVGVWRPIHRKLGLRRSDMWAKPEAPQ